MTINKAILHIFDFRSDVCVLSEKELDISDEIVCSFLEKHIERSFSDANQKHGKFLQNSIFKNLMCRYDQRNISFIDFSTVIANMLYEQILKSDIVESTDFVFVDFTIESTQYIALLLLKNKTAFTHQAVNDADGIHNEIIKYYAILPNVSQKIDYFAIINRKDFSIGFIDRKRLIDGKDTFVLPDVILQCNSIISSTEALKVVNQITTNIAEKYGVNSAIAISKAKNYLFENAEISSTFSPLELGKEVFADSEAMQSEFERDIKEVELPSNISLAKSVAVRTSKTHKIRTDTGIEIIFPADYFENHDFIKFVNNPDGTISIELKNIGKIINR